MKLNILRCFRYPLWHNLVEISTFNVDVYISLILCFQLDEQDAGISKRTDEDFIKRRAVFDAEFNEKLAVCFLDLLLYMKFLILGLR